MDVGSAADWTAALLTGGGLLAAAYQIRHARLDAEAARARQRADDAARREHQARAVGITAYWRPADEVLQPATSVYKVSVEILNGGEYPISDAVLHIDQDESSREVVYGTILPGKREEQVYEVTRHNMPFSDVTGGVTLLFTDTFGQHWARTPYSLEQREFAAHIC